MAAVDQRPAARVLVYAPSARWRLAMARAIEAAGAQCVAAIGLPSALPATVQRMRPTALLLDAPETPAQVAELMEALRGLPTPPPAGWLGALPRDTPWALPAQPMLLRRPEGLDDTPAWQALGERLRALYAQHAAPPQPRPARAAANAAIAGRVKLVAIGISTGGPPALRAVIPALPADLGVPIALVQHMPEYFTGHLANSLNQQSPLQVFEASEGATLGPGQVVIARGGAHLTVRRGPTGGAWTVHLDHSPPRHGCRPAVDVLLESLAGQSVRDVLSVIMTGMGYDGRAGVAQLKKHGAYCLAQDAASCAVNGMPQAVVDAGAADEVVPLDAMAARITALVQGR